MDREVNWHELNMLDVYVEMCEGQLDSSRKQLENLQSIQSKPHILDDKILERIIKLHSSQCADNWIFFEQCSKWREQNPDDEQLRQIAILEKSAYELETVNQNILLLAKSFQGKTIDAILAKDPMELFLHTFEDDVTH